MSPRARSRETDRPRYAAAAGRDLADLDYYTAFGYWKLACVLEGVFTRFGAGAYEHEDAAVRAFGEVVHDLVDHADEALSRHAR